MIHNRYVVRAGQTAYELCSARMYGGKIALFGICHGIFAHFSEVCSFMTRGLWLGKTSTTMRTWLVSLVMEARCSSREASGVFHSMGSLAHSRFWSLSLAVWPCRSWFPVGGCKEDHRPSAQYTGSICCTWFSNDPDARAMMGIPGTPDDDEAIVMAPAKVPRQSLPHQCKRQ